MIIYPLKVSSSQFSMEFSLKLMIFLDGRHYKSASGAIEPGYNILEVGIMQDHASNNPVGFGVEVENEDGEIIQCCVILQPMDANLFILY